MVDRTTLCPGDVLGRLRLLEELGRGATGIVYKAYDPRLDRNVALKLLLATGEDSLDRGHKRLVKEAQAMAQLSHPHVVTVHDVGTVDIDGQVRVFIEMEYLRGGSLERTIAAWRAAAPAPGIERWREVLRVFLDAGEGLAAAHAHQLVHRDFKPANVLLDEDGRAKVGDFGLVRRVEREEDDPSLATRDEAPPGGALDTPVTQTGALVGTPAYMAPEQFEGDKGDARSDQFAFCVALYETLCGHRPFAGDDIAQLARAVLEDEPRPPSASADVPAFVVRALSRGMRRDPRERHRDMRALLDALGAEPRSRARAALGILGVSAVGAAAAVGLGWWLEPGVLALTVVGLDGNSDNIEVVVDGRRHPVEGGTLELDLPTGDHWLAVEAADHARFEHSFEVRRGKTHAVLARLQHDRGTVDLDVYPQGARLQLDGSERGSALHGLELDTGHHALRVSVPGRHEVQLGFQLSKGQRVGLAAYLPAAVVFREPGGAMLTKLGGLGDADGDGRGDVWSLDYSTLSAYSPTTGEVLWRQTISDDSDAGFLHMLDVDGDGVRDAVTLGVGETGSVLRVLAGSRTRADPLLWSASGTGAATVARPLAAPVVVGLPERPTIVATSLEADTVTAYAGATGEVRWRRAIDGPSFGLTAGRAADGHWVAVAHMGGVTMLDAQTGAVRWDHAIETFGPQLVEGLEQEHSLVHRARRTPWMVAADLDDREGQDLALPAATDPGGGPVLALAGEDGAVLWHGPRVHPMETARVGDLDGDGYDELAVVRREPSMTSAVFEVGEDVTSVWVDGKTGALRRSAPAGEIVLWPCDGGTPHQFGRDAQGVYARDTRTGEVSARFELDEDVHATCSDWDGDGAPELLLASSTMGLRAYDRRGAEIGAVATPGAVQMFAPLGDIDGDARPDFVLDAAGPTVVLGTRIVWARAFDAPLRAAPVIDDFDGDGVLEVVTFDGQQDESAVVRLSAADGRLLDRGPAGVFGLRTPAVVSGMHPGTKDFVFTAHKRVVRVLGHDFSMHVLDIDGAREAYAGPWAGPDGRTLWITSWDRGPHLRGVAAAPGEWVPGTGGSGQSFASQPWTTFVSIDAQTGSWVRPQLGPLDDDPAAEVVAVLDRGRMIVVDAESGACQWSRWVGAGRVRAGPALVDLDGDGSMEVLAGASVEAPAAAPGCDQASHKEAPESTPDLIAVDGSSGALRWRVPGGGSSVSAPVAVDEGGERWVVATSAPRGLFAVDTEGVLRWSSPERLEVTSPLGVGDIDADGRSELVFGTKTGHVHVHDAATGAHLWAWAPPQAHPQQAAPVLADLDGDGDLEIVVATYGQVLFVLDGTFVAE